MNEPHAANQLLLAAVFQVRAPDVDVVLRERLDHLSQTQPEADELRGIDQHFVLLLLAPEAVHLDDTRNCAELWLDEPVQQGTQFHQRILALACRITERELIDLAQAG